MLADRRPFSSSLFIENHYFFLVTIVHITAKNLFDGAIAIRENVLDAKNMKIKRKKKD